jgi:flagellar biosynthesis protein FlhG
MDQANTLRQLMRERAALDSVSPQADTPGPRVFTIASGKGGVGKSLLAANLGALLARSGLRTMLVDGDTGLANLDILLGLPVESRPTLEQVLSGEARLKDAIVGVEPNLWLIPAATGLLELRQGGPETRLRLLEMFKDCPWEMDVVLIDAGAGIGPNVLSLQHASFGSIVVLTPDPTSLADAYSLIKLARRDAGVRRFSIAVNQVTDGRHGLSVFQKLKDVAARFSDAELEYLGHCPRDEKIAASVLKRKILIDLDQGAPAVACLELLAKRMGGKCRMDRVAAESSNATSYATSSDSPNVLSPLRMGQTSAKSEKTAAAEASGVSSRFQEEPARAAPGNTAKFWRALLGEVRT